MWNYRLINFKYVRRVRSSETKTQAVPMPLDTSLLFIKGNRSREHEVPCAGVCVCVCVCSGESVPTALDASNTRRYSSENHYTEVTAETSPSASVLQGEFTLPVSRTHSHRHAQSPNQLIALRATNYANKLTKIETQAQHKALWDSKEGDWIIKSTDMGIWVNNTNR